MRKFFLGAALIATVCFFFSVSAAFSSEAIRIGLMCPLTGKWASEGQEMRRFATFLAEETNAAGGVDGRKIELIIEDDAGDPRTAALAAQKLVSLGVAAIIGAYGSAVTEATQNIIDEAGIVQIAQGSTSVRLTKKGLPLFFRASPRDSDQGQAAADIIVSKGYKAVALLHDNSSYSKGLAQETEKLLKSKGVSIVFFDALTPGEQDYASTLTKLQAAKPDVIFFTGYYPEAGMLLRQKAEMNWRAPMMGGDGTNNVDLVRIAGKKAAQGYEFISPPTAEDLENSESKASLSKYKERYGSAPQSVWSLFAGDAFKAVVGALKKTKDPTPQNIAALLKDPKEVYVGITGPISFDQYGDRVGNLYRAYVVNQEGAFVSEK